MSAHAPWVLVTGGAVRLGREIVLAFAHRGWNVACHYRRSANEAATLRAQVEAAGRRCVTVQGDLDDPAAAEAMFAQAVQRAGAPLSCVVNNASSFDPDTGAGFEPRQMLAALTTNLVVPLLLGKLLHAQAEGVANASVVHLLDQKVHNLNPDYFSYTLSKIALAGATRQQAQALAPRVRVNAVAPGLMYQSGPQTAENFALAAQANLLRRPIAPANVAAAVVFLAENDGMTGQTLAVDNGQQLVPLPRDIMFVVEELLAGGRA